MTSARVAGRSLLGAALLLAGVACSSASPAGRATTSATKHSSTTTAASAPAAEHPAYAAVVDAEAQVFAEPASADAPFLTLADRNENGAPQTLLVRAERALGGERWFQVLLPIRPNGSSGWVRSTQVHLVGLPYRLVVDQKAFRLEVFRGEELLRSIAIGVGTDQTPTPGGTYYIKELLRPPDQDTVYGHYVFGLSGFSNVLVDWPGGGVLGIHGTNDPDHALGHQVSHGCIRMRNDDIEYLATLLPLGTPVVISS
ncbi:MAG: ErfK/YbiS/YcfS/YnhG family protein [Actinomycetia bacterium]|nr:ErfK/YbiS/YcfS/YnhG family protein [Actinomycetes bacterium]